jgi:PAP_fibrillin
MRLFLVPAFLAATPLTLGFSSVIVSRRAKATHSRTMTINTPVLFSEPSDTSIDDTPFAYGVVDTDSTDYTPTAGEAMVSNMLDLMPKALGDVSDETRTAINEALYKLEALNPTKAPTVSPLLNGVWELRYVGGYSPDWALPSPTRQLALFLYSGGYSPGVFALSLAQKLPSGLVDVGDLEVAISREQPRVEASIPVKMLGGAESQVLVKARLEVKSDLRMRETYEVTTVLGNTIELPQPLQYSRDLYVTYVDDDLLIVRDASGVPEVLVRKEKTFSKKWGTEPSEADGMGPPGEEIDGTGPSGSSDL